MNPKTCFVVSLLCVLVGCSTMESSGTTSSQALGESRSLPGAQISDLRLCHSQPEAIEARIREKVCLLDARGRVFGAGETPIPPQNVSCDNKPSLGTILDRLRIDLKSLGGVQLRLFKRDQIVQTSRFYRNRRTDEFDKLRALTVEPGDVILFTVEE